MMMRRCSLVVTLALSGCATTSSTTAAPTAPTASEAPTTTPTETPAGNTLTALQNGDRACYVVIETADAGQRSLEGDFELCEGGEHDATALIGHRVTWTTEKARVQAASCQGDPECSESDEVDLVVSLQPAP